MTNPKNNSPIPMTEDCFYLSFQELTCSFGVDPQLIVEIVEEGIIIIQKNDRNEWKFDNTAVRRIQTVLHLHEDLGINLAGAALVLDLLDEIDALQRQIRV